MTARPYLTVSYAGTARNSQAVDSVTITHGRQAVGQDIAPATCQLRFLRQSVTWPLNIGDDVVVDAYWFAPSVNYTRFRGDVVSVTWSPYFVDILATSAAFGRLARSRVVEYVVNKSNGTPRPVYAIDKVINDSGANTGLVGYSGLGYVTLMSDVDIGTTSGLDAALSIASWDVYGLLRETLDGECYYNAYRNDTSAAWTLPAAGVFDDWSVTYDLAAMGNIQSVVYNGDQSATVADYGSVATYGAFSQSRTMQCTDVADALSGANASLLAGGTPWPIVTGVGFDVTALPSRAVQETVMASTVDTVVDTAAAAAYIPGLPDLCVIEGWTETITRHTWTLRYNLSDVNQTLRPETWAEVTPTLAWSAVSPTLTWRDMISGSL